MMESQLKFGKKNGQNSIKRNQQQYNSNMKDPRTGNQLLEAIAKHRDKGAFLELFNRYGKNANALACHITGDQNLAEEAVQEGLLNVWVSAHTFRLDGNAKKWLLCVVANAANQVLRGRSREKLRIQKSALLDPPQLEVRNEYEEVEARESVLETLRQQTLQLAAKDRKLLSLYYGAGLNQSEIGEMLSLPQRTVSHRLKEALTVLRENLGRAGYSSVLAGFTGAVYQKALLSGSYSQTLTTQELLAALEGLNKQDDIALVASKGLSVLEMGRGWGVIIGCCVLLMGGAFALTFQKNHQVPEEGNLDFESEKLNAVEVSPRDGFFKKWAFDPANRPNILASHRDWDSWLPAKGKLLAGAQSPFGSNNAIWLALPVKFTGQPFVVTISLRIPSKNFLVKNGLKTAGCNGFVGSAGTFNELQARWTLRRSARMKRDPHYSFREQIYVKGAYQVQLSDDYSFPTQIVQYVSHRHTEFSVGFHGYIIEWISVQIFNEDTFPIESDKWESLTLKADSITQLYKANLNSLEK